MAEEKKIKIILTIDDEVIQFFATKNGKEKFQFIEPMEVDQRVFERLQRMVQEYYDIKDCCEDTIKVEISDVD